MFDVQPIYSWTWMWDFVVISVFMVSALHVMFDEVDKNSPAGLIFLSGTAIIVT